MSSIPAREYPGSFLTTFMNSKTRRILYKSLDTTIFVKDGATVLPSTKDSLNFWETDELLCDELRKEAKQPPTEANGEVIAHDPDCREGKGTHFASDLVNPNTMSKPNVLCSRCQSLIAKSLILHGRFKEIKATKSPGELLQRKERIEIFEHHETFDMLKASCAIPCHLCTLLWDILDDQMSEISGTSTTDCQARVFVQIMTSKDGEDAHMNAIVQKEAPIRIEDNRQRCIQIERRSRVLPANSSYDIHMKQSKRDEEEHLEEGYNTDDDDQSHKQTKNKTRSSSEEFKLLDDSHASQLSVSTASDASFSLASSWIRSCLHSHTICQATPLFPRVLPSRLVFIGSTDLHIPANVQPMAGLSTIPPYLTLSHCWGGVHSLRLTTENIELLTTALPIEEMPKTFLDSMEITRKLGYDYIWIDSLCIIQDDENDWAKESAIMGYIYGNSVCNIAALASKDSNGGCFRYRNPLLYRPCRLIENDVEQVYGFGYGDPNESSDTKKSKARLLQRVWVFQEIALSPRTLFYGHSGIYWQCVHGRATECQPTLTVDVGNSLDSGNIKRLFINMHPSMTIAQFRSQWSRIVEEYSSCSLTRTSDVLPAVRGIAKILEEYLETPYFAGIWMTDLLDSILWRAIKPADNRPTPYRAPSWSWASLDSEVAFSKLSLRRGQYESFRDMSIHVKYKLTAFATLRDMNVLPTHAGEQDNGSVSDGYLIISAPFRQIEWNANARARFLHTSSDSRSSNDEWRPDYEQIPSTGLWAALIYRGHINAVQETVGTTFGVERFENARVDMGILLRCVGTVEATDIFERCGYFEQYFWTDDDYPIFSGSKLNSIRSEIMIC